jgi:hypothetical protein
MGAPRDAHLNRTDKDTLKILARSIARQLLKNGYGLRHIVALAGELISLASESIRSRSAPKART